MDGIEQVVYFGDEHFPKRSATIREITLYFFVAAAALDGLDFDWRISESFKVVRRGAHVDLAAGEGELEALPENVGTYPRHGFVRPFVEIHVGVDAARLLHLLSRFVGRLVAVQRDRTWCKKPKRVIMRAAKWTGFHDRVYLILWETKPC